MATTQQFELVVNGEAVTVDADEATPLLAVLRNRLGLKATRFGCGLEQCGACMVLVDGQPAYSCSQPIRTAAGKSITTVEGLGTPESPHPLQSAVLAEQAGQCGYCLSGMIMEAAHLLDRNKRPTEAEIRAALDGVLCRCGAHVRIVRAVQRAADVLA